MSSFDFPTQTIFYTIENAIKKYRKFSQKKISDIVKDVTIDQLLVLIIIQKNPDYNQIEIAEMLFKDYASMTRMINLLVTNGHLNRVVNKSDRRRSTLLLTKKGKETVKKLKPVILENRKTALKKISKKEQKELERILEQLIANCS